MVMMEGAEDEEEDVDEKEDRELGVTSKVYVEENESSTVTSQVVKSSETTSTAAVGAAEDSSTGSLDDGNSGGGSVVSSRIFGQGNTRRNDDYYNEDDDESEQCSFIKNKQRCNNRDNCRVSKGSSFPFCCCFLFVPVCIDLYQENLPYHLLTPPTVGEW